MIAKEGLPALRRWLPSLCHVFCYGRLADIDAELEQLAVNPWRSPQRVGNAHLANELTNVHGRLWPAARVSIAFADKALAAAKTDQAKARAEELAEGRP